MIECFRSKTSPIAIGLQPCDGFLLLKSKEISLLVPLYESHFRTSWGSGSLISMMLTLP